MLIRTLKLADIERSAMKFAIEGKLAKMPTVKNYKQPLYEAVSNAIQSTQLRKNKSSKDCGFLGKISVQVKYKPRTENLSKSGQLIADGGIIDSLTVIDNGEGFTDENFHSFDTVDTTFKRENFACRGEGRFLWLKSFREVLISSVFLQDGVFLKREFTFDKVGELVHQAEEPKLASTASDCKTTVVLSEILDEVVNKKPVGLNAIVQGLLSHFLLDLLESDAPEISIVDEENNLKLIVNEVLKEYLLGSPFTTEFSIRGVPFKLTGQKIKFSSATRKISGVYLSAGRRIVENVNISESIPEFSEKLVDSDGTTFSYVGIVSSSFLDEYVDSSRTKFVFPTEIETSGNSQLPSPNELKESIAEKVREQLGASLVAIRKKGRERLRKYVETEGPEYRDFFNLNKELYISPSAKPSEVREFFTIRFARFEVERNRKVDELLKINWDKTVDPTQEIEKIQKTISPVSHHGLAKFASSRKFYINMLEKVCKYKESDEKKYQYEDALHSLIYPKKKDSTDTGISHNLWLIDESLAFHHYLASDKEFRNMKCVQSESKNAPDLMSLRLYGDKDADDTAEFVFVEFKRPGRKNYAPQQDPIKQITGYVKDLRQSKIVSLDGRPLNSEHCPIYYYLICDIDKSLRECLENEHDFHPNALGDHFYGFKSKLAVFIEVLTLTALRRETKERNQALMAAAGL